MTETTVIKSEPTPEEEEENGRTTPVRQLQLQEAQQSLNAEPASTTKDKTDKESDENVPDAATEKSANEATQNEQPKNIDTNFEKTMVVVAGSTAIATANNDPPANIPTHTDSEVSEKLSTNVAKQNQSHVPATASEKTICNENISSVSQKAAATEQSVPTNVRIKDEPQDTHTADLEITLAHPRMGDENIATDILKTPRNNTDAAQASQTLTPEQITALVKEESDVFDDLEKELSEYSDKSMTVAATSEAEPPPPPPMISAVPTFRLRVKPEFCETTSSDTPTDVSTLPQDFFEDLLTQPTSTAPMTLADHRIKDEPIPENFFDDILVDKVPDHIEATAEQELEVKYGERLKQLEELRRLERKKHKKSKKKSRRHDRSRSPSRRSPSDERSKDKSYKRERSGRSRTPEHHRSRHEHSPGKLARHAREKTHKRERSPSPRHRRSSRSRSRSAERAKQMRRPENPSRSDWQEAPTTSKRSRLDNRDVNVRVKIENKRYSNDSNSSDIEVIDLGQRMPEVVEIPDEPLDDETMQPHLPEMTGLFTAKQKRERALLRAKTLVSYLNTNQNVSENKKVEVIKPLSTFLYTSTVRKLPTSESYRNQHVYENRSPLHNVNNVSYKFNCHANRFNMEEWGLATLTPLSANIAKMVGYNAEAIYKKLKVIKVPTKIRKLQKEVDSNADDVSEDEDTSLQPRSSLFCNATTQTDEAVEVLQRKPKGYDIGVQAVQPAFAIGCQTLETESPSIKQFDNSDELPIMPVMRKLNDNQLIALQDFAELLMETPSNTMDMYRLRQRMLDIYKFSQIPSTLLTTQQTGNSYSSNERPTSSSSGTHTQSQENDDLRIQNVRSLNDPRRHRPNDPRTNREGWADNNAIRNAASAQAQRYQPSTNGAKFYGRGGLRR